MLLSASLVYVPGLSLQIFLDQGNYMLNKLTPNAGAKLVIHEAENTPLPDEKGIDLKPNTETTVAIQKVTTGWPISWRTWVGLT